MKLKILNVAGSEILSKKAQQNVKGGIGGSGKPDFSKCGCDCAGNVTGPSYCGFYFACPQVYTCQETS